MPWADLAGFCHQLRRRHHPADQPDPLRLGGINAQACGRLDKEGTGGAAPGLGDRQGADPALFGFLHQRPARAHLLQPHCSAACGDHLHGVPLPTTPCRFSSHRTTARLSSHKPAAAPVRIISMARLLPTARVRRCVPPMPGITPREISGCAAMGRIRGWCAVTCRCCLCRGSCSRNLELRAKEMAQRMPQRCTICAS